MVGGGIVDQWAHEGLRVRERLTDDQPVDQLLDRLDQRLLLAVLDDQPPGGGAALPGGQIGRLDDDCRGRFDILGAPDD